MMGVDSHGKWGVPKQALKWEVVQTDKSDI